MLPACSFRRTPVPKPIPPGPSVRPSATRRLRTGVALAGTGLSLLIGLAGLFAPSGAASASLPSGKGVVLRAPVVGAAATPDGQGYWVGAADGGIFAYGDARFYGSTGGKQLNEPIVAVDGTPDGRGYWEVASDGGVFTFGDAKFHGSTGNIRLNRPVVGLESTPDGGGYVMVASDGGIFAFGDAHFYGSAAGKSPTSPIVGVALTPDGRGYWEAAADGAVFSFGDAHYAGRPHPVQPVVGISAAGAGYRLVSADGGVFTFGGASFYGSTGGKPLNKPIITMASAAPGYITVAADGGVFAFGGSGFYGSLGGSTVVEPAPAVVAGDGVTDFQRAAWSRVNMCEEGGVWNVQGPVYSGGLGFSHANWNQFNTFGYPSNAAYATPEQQIRVAVAFATHYWGNPNAAPDQHGCTGGY